MCAGAERATACRVSDRLGFVKRPESLCSFDSNLLFRASCFFHYVSPDKTDDFLRLAGDFNDEVPKCISEDDLGLILATVKHPTASVAEICDETHTAPKDTIFLEAASR